MIKLQSVGKVFNSGSSIEVMGVKDLSLTISSGEFVVVIGSNGSGKSSLLNMVSGGIIPDYGAVYLDQVEVTHKPEYFRSKWISHIFQNPLSGTAPDLSILDNFRLASIRTSPKGLGFGIDEKFKRKVKDRISLLGMGLENKLGQAMGTLSGGQRQALTLIMAIMDEAKILLMDEPTAALDVKSAHIVMDTAKKIIEEFGLTTLLVTHNLKDVIQFGDRIIQMSGGSLVRDIFKKDIPNLNLSEVYAWMDQDDNSL